MIRVGILRGGSSNFESSFKNGGIVVSHLGSSPYQQSHKAIDLLVDNNGVWHMGGVPVDMDRVHKSVDVVFNALDNDYGADGKIAQQLHQWNIPHTASGAMPSALSY